jgi:predicted aspartyl protease
MISKEAILSKTNEVDFRLVGGAQPLILLPVRLSGKGPFDFILDTGAGMTILAPEISRTLEIKSTGSKEGRTAAGAVKVELGRVDSVSVGSATVTDLPVAITDLSHISRTIGAKIDGDLGYNFFKHFRLSIDYRSKQATIVRPSPRADARKPAARAEVKLRLASPTKPLILVDTLVNGRGPFQFAIDTGTSTTAISPELAVDFGLSVAPLSPVTTGSSTISVSAGQVDSLAIDGVSIPNVAVIVGDFLAMLSQVLGVKLDGIIGYNFLKEFKVVLDYPGGILRLE